MEDLTDIVEQLSTALDEQRAEYKRLYEMLRAFGDSAPNLFWAKDLRGRFTHCNEPQAKFLGAENGEAALGTTDEDWFTDTEGGIYGGGVNSDTVTLTVGKPCIFLEQGMHRGEFYAMRVSKAPYYDSEGKLIGTVGSAYDVTERVERVNQHMELMYQFRRLLNNEKPSVDALDTYETLVQDFSSLADRHKLTEAGRYHG